MSDVAKLNERLKVLNDDFQKCVANANAISGAIQEIRTMIKEAEAAGRAATIDNPEGK